MDTTTRKSQWEHPGRSRSPLPHPPHVSSVQARPPRKPISTNNKSPIIPTPSLSGSTLNYQDGVGGDSLDLTPWATNTRAKLEIQLDSLRREHSVAALGVGIVSADGPPEIFIRGFRRLDCQISVTRSDKFTLSFNDSMTFAILAMIIDRGLITWESRIVNLLPAISKRAHPFHNDTTLAMLTSHRSGISADLYAADHGDLLRYLSRPEIGAKQGRFATALYYLVRPPDHTPGTQFLWHKANSLLIALALETVTNQPFEKLLKSLLFDPLEMYSAGLGWPDMARNKPSNPTQPWPHSESNKQPIDILPGRDLNMNSMYPVQGVHCSVPDYAAYIKFVLRCTMGLDTARLLRKETMERCHARISDDDFSYNCAGWSITTRDWAEGIAITLSGRAHGASNNAWMSPKTGKAFFAISNIDGDVGLKINDEAVSAAIRYDLHRNKAEV